jgi:hypothetical protein
VPVCEVLLRIEVGVYGAVCVTLVFVEGGHSAPGLSFQAPHCYKEKRLRPDARERVRGMMPGISPGGWNDPVLFSPVTLVEAGRVVL